jgi:hypothetical protein
MFSDCNLGNGRLGVAAAFVMGLGNRWDLSVLWTESSIGCRMPGAERQLSKWIPTFAERGLGMDPRQQLNGQMNG